MYLIQNLSNVNDTEESTDTVKQKKRFFIIPFINKLFNTVTSCLNKKLFVVRYKSLNRLNNFIKVQKY